MIHEVDTPNLISSPAGSHPRPAGLAAVAQMTEHSNQVYPLPGSRGREFESRPQL